MMIMNFLVNLELSSAYLGQIVKLNKKLLDDVLVNIVNTGYLTFIMFVLYK